MTARLFHSPAAEVLAGQEVRNAIMRYLRDHAYDVGKDWKRMYAQSSLTLTSPCGRKVVKIDNTKVCTVDTKTDDGWKTLRFTPKTIEESWRVAVQTIKAFDNQRSRNALH